MFKWLTQAKFMATDWTVIQPIANMNNDHGFLHMDHCFGICHAIVVQKVPIIFVVGFSWYDLCICDDRKDYALEILGLSEGERMPWTRQMSRANWVLFSRVIGTTTTLPLYDWVTSLLDAPKRMIV